MYNTCIKIRAVATRIGASKDKACVQNTTGNEQELRHLLRNLLIKIHAVASGDCGVASGPAVRAGLTISKKMRKCFIVKLCLF
jgi:hypothetical protein